MAFVKKISGTCTDAELVQLYKLNGSMSVLGDLYQRYMDLVYGVCLKYLADNENAKDAVINIFEELVAKLKKYEVDNFKGWLYQLSKNHCLIKIRSSKNKLLRVDVDIVYLSESMHLEEAEKKENDLTQMEICIGQLPDDQKKAVQLFYLKDKCYKEIAEETAVDINKIRSFIQNGRRNLKICMEKQALQKAK